MRQYEGASTALITPLNGDGTIDYKSLQRLAEFQITNGINGLVPCGTTGQSPTLSWAEHYGINDIVITARNRAHTIPIIVGAGSNATREGVEATKVAAQMGADATLHVSGYYNAPAQEGFAQYFQSVAEAAPTGVIIYNIPGRGHPIIHADVIAALAKAHPNIIGTKDATGGKALRDDEDASFWRAVRREAGERGLNDFLILSGDDPLTYQMMTDPAISGNGVISVWSNLFPHVYSEMTAAVLGGNPARAREINESLKGLNRLVGVTSSYPLKIGDETLAITNDNWRNPQPVQFAAYLLGMINNPAMRSPMSVPPESVQNTVGAALYRLHEAHPSYFDAIQRTFSPQPAIADRLAKYGGVV
ncbi:MAG: 4-hydroxy-tetrahydrodipicolinate synthase [Candidatus Aenigmarchaeota archaeon]|nr:4-hydroxy-tetrahydrodipicolinate synthase [Candidatus Aenigmarchaeota archaeon]